MHNLNASSPAAEGAQPPSAASRMSSRTWNGVLNNPSKAYPLLSPEEYLEKWHTAGKARYVCGQLERGEDTGTPHIQFYLNFKNETRMAALKKHCKWAHFTPVRRDNGAAEYAMKEETRVDGPWEFGTRPVKRDSKEDWQRVFKLAKEGKMDEIPADIKVRHYGNLKRIEKDHVQVRGQHTSTKGIWLHGPPGCGKSSFARYTYPDCY